MLATLFVFQLEGSALGASIFTQTAQGTYPNNVLFGNQWDDFTAMMVAQHTIIQGAAFDDLSNLLLYDAVWVDQELGSALTAAEQAALTAYISAGHKVVLIGENDSWASWLPTIMNVVGGSHIAVCSWDIGAPNSAQPLTKGVNTVQNICGSLIDVNAGNPDILFSNDMAATYCVGAGQALVILDSNWNDDDYWAEDNMIFAQNIVDWLSTPVDDLCPWDLDDSGTIGVSDLLLLLASWGPCKGCPADFDGNDNVGVSDLLALLANWGPCP